MAPYRESCKAVWGNPISFESYCPGGESSQYPQLLQVKLRSKNSPSDRDNLRVHVASLTPVDVEKLILAGLSQGWKPESRGNFKVTGPLDLEQFQVAPGPKLENSSK